MHGTRYFNDKKELHHHMKAKIGEVIDKDPEAGELGGGSISTSVSIVSGILFAINIGFI